MTLAPRSRWLLALAMMQTSLVVGGCASAPPPSADPYAGYLPESNAERLAYTDGLASGFKVSGDQRRLLQYYVSDTIHLVRSSSGGQSGIRDGRLISSSSQAVREIVIDSGTPGVVLASGPRWMAVSFEPGSYLYFISDAPRSVWLGNEYDRERYYLYLPDWNGQGGTVKIGNTSYVAVDSSIRAHLMVDRESFSSMDAQQRRQPGRLLYPNAP